MATSITTDATTTTLNNNGNAYLTVSASDVVSLTNPLPVASGGTGSSALSYVRLNSANGYGATNTKIRRFTNIVDNVGSDITYADSSTLGASFTINTAGLYSVHYSDQFNAADQVFGLSLNSTQLTTNVGTLAVGEILCVVVNYNANWPSAASSTFYASATDVVRPHTQAGVTGSQNDLCHFTIARVA
jgi:hypothetical protein|tara:strand:+ start:634 stop:1197 length:564 start_codon:yes stop_codon:yes gene_type:complete